MHFSRVLIVCVAVLSCWCSNTKGIRTKSKGKLKIKRKKTIRKISHKWRAIVSDSLLSMNVPIRHTSITTYLYLVVQSSVIPFKGKRLFVNYHSISMVMWVGNVWKQFQNLVLNLSYWSLCILPSPHQSAHFNRFSKQFHPMLGQQALPTFPFFSSSTFICAFPSLQTWIKLLHPHPPSSNLYSVSAFHQSISKSFLYINLNLVLLFQVKERVWWSSKS
jgi:hypothetical protein